MFATDWENLTVAGAFVVGLALGSVLAVRLAKVLIGLFEERHDQGR